MRRLHALPLFLLCAAQAAARAGGGEGYSGGSGSGGDFVSGFDGGSGGGANPLFLLDLVRFYVWLLIHQPLIGVPLTAATAWMIYFVWTSASSDDEGTAVIIARGNELQRSNRRIQARSALLARDPGFDESLFLERAGRAFVHIQEAWSLSNVLTARRFLSDGVYERFRRLLDWQRESGLRNRVTGVRVLESEIMGYGAGRRFDSIAVRFRAAAKDETVAAADGRVLKTEPTEFEEVWTFVRRPGAKTLKRPGLIEGSCPSCGKPLAIADAALCVQCKTWVNSGEHDWVLVEITQPGEWRFPIPEAEVCGWGEMIDADPEFSLESLEDRAAAVFWRWLDARRRRDPGPLRGSSTGELAGRLAFDESELRPAVGAVETVAFEHGPDFDRAHVQIRWEAEDVRFDAQGRPETLGRRRRTHYLIFKRKAGAQSDLKAGLSSSRCPSCGAPPEEADAPSCRYCSRPFNDGSRGWVLDDVRAYGSWRRPPSRPLASPALSGLDWGEELAPLEAVSALACGLASDGRAHDHERAFLGAYAVRRGVPAPKAEELLQAALEGRLDPPVPRGGTEAEGMLRGLIRMSLADGRLEDKERALLAAVGRRAGLHESELRAMIREERTLLRERAEALLGSGGAAVES